MSKKNILPAILSADPDECRQRLSQLETFATWAQLDILDNEFAKNSTCTVKSLIGLHSPVALEVHLMVKRPLGLIADCRDLGARRVIFHIEAQNRPKSLIKKIHSYKMEVGIALNPETPLAAVGPWLSAVEVILLLAVHPGWQGQVFMPMVLEKIAEYQRQRKNDWPSITVDGGVNLQNAGRIAKAGADNLVVGSALWNSPDPKKTFQQFEYLFH